MEHNEDFDGSWCLKLSSFEFNKCDDSEDTESFDDICAVEVDTADSEDSDDEDLVEEITEEFSSVSVLLVLDLYKAVDGWKWLDMNQVVVQGKFISLLLHMIMVNYSKSEILEVSN